MSVLSFMNCTCTIRRMTAGDATITGSTTYTPSDTTGVSCGIQVTKASQKRYPVEAGDTEFDVYFIAGTDVRTSDRLVSIVDPAGLWANATLEVASRPADDAGFGDYYRVVARHVEGDSNI